MASAFSYYEFFAGGGMVRAGLGADWRCLFANDFDPKKTAAYAVNWGGERLVVGDVAKLTAKNLPSAADMAWASFPCQDLSLAGQGAGLNGERSGAFWPFWNLMTTLSRKKRAPRLIVLENVSGLLTSHGGEDFSALMQALNKTSYHFGAVAIDARHFLPQSRPRLFIVAVRSDLCLPDLTVAPGPIPLWHSDGIRRAYAQLPVAIQRNWIWWNLPEPPGKMKRLADLIEREPSDVAWRSEADTQRLLDRMTPIHRARVERHLNQPWAIGAVYMRTRLDERGGKVQRPEARFDEYSGCLRTPAGGSSRQIILVIENGRVRSRLLSAREAARLMGLPDSYQLPTNYNDAYHLAGDGVAVPVVRFLAQSLLEPVLEAQSARMAA